MANAMYQLPMHQFRATYDNPLAYTDGEQLHDPQPYYHYHCASPVLYANPHYREDAYEHEPEPYGYRHAPAPRYAPRGNPRAYGYEPAPAPAPMRRGPAPAQDDRYVTPRQPGQAPDMSAGAVAAAGCAGGLLAGLLCCLGVGACCVLL